MKFPKWQRIILLIILAYEGWGGITGGTLLTFAPDGHVMKMPTEMMHGVFPDFIIPGIILTGMGYLTTVAFFSVLFKNKLYWFFTGLSLVGYLIWFMVEIIVLRELHWLHIMWGVPVILGLSIALPNTIRYMKVAKLFGHKSTVVASSYIHEVSGLRR